MATGGQTNPAPLQVGTPGGGKGGVQQVPTSFGTPGTPQSASSMYANPLQQQQSGNVYSQSAADLAAGSANTGQAAGIYGNLAANPVANTAQYGGNTLSQMGQYMNPYTSGVIDRTMNDIGRQTAIQQNANASNAAMSGAFGGARHGLVEATTNSEAQKNMADYAANLYNQEFNTAAGLAQGDVNRIGQNNQFNANQFDSAANRQLVANQGLLSAAGQQGQFAGQGFDMGNTLGDRQFQQGEFARQLQQQVMNGANAQFDKTTGQPVNMLNTILSALSGSPMNNASTTTGQYTPGMFDYLSLGTQMVGGGLGSGKGGK